MKCPHCREGIHAGFASLGHHAAGDSLWTMLFMTCPDCKEAIVDVKRMDKGGHQTGVFSAYPSDPSHRRPLPPEIPDPYQNDFEEAVGVLAHSAKASAALSRRSLQALLKDKADTTKKDLFDQIEEVIASGKLPSHLSDGLHAVRNIGNFAAHEMKSKVTGEIVDVEPGEAEWNLDILESLFDFYFVEPAKTAKRKAELNEKLKAVGKPEMP